MSGVYRRNRHVSGCAWFTKAIELRKEIVLLARSSAMPKSLRFTFAEPMCATARSLVMHIVESDSFYPYNEQNVEERKRRLTLAIADCEMLWQDMQCLLDIKVGVKASRLERVAELVDEVETLLRSARSGVKLIAKR